MKKTKKFLSLLLALSMVISMAVPMAFAADFTDVPQTHQYYEAIQSLVARGIISGMGDGTFAPNATIKRSEFAKMVIYAIGMGNFVGSGAVETGFPDVAADHWAAGVIKAAHDQGIINGYDDGTFKPDEPVTYEQAIKMTVCAKSAALGSVAEKNGGYPEGYKKLGQSYGFVKGITDGSYTAPATRGTIAKLIDNMLKINLSEQMGNLPTIENTNQLEEVEGQIVAVYGASIESSSTKLTKNQIKVILSDGDEQIFNISNLSNKDTIASYLGKLVVIYYRDDYSVEVPEISSLSEKRSRNEEIIVNVADIYDYSNTEVVYYDSDSDDETSLRVDSNAVIVYNGSYYDDKTFGALLDDNINNAGSIRFLCTEGEDTAADVIFFTSYVNWFVTSKSSSTKLVYGEVGGISDKIEINDESDSIDVTILKDGKEVSFSNIAKNQVLSISKSADGKKMEVLISDDTVTGRVSAMTRGEKKLTINSKEYFFASGVTFGDEITVSSNLKLYLDSFGRVAKYDFQAASANYIYAYLLQFKNFGNSMSSDIYMQVLNLNSTSNKQATELKLADRVTVNGKTYTTAEDFNTILEILKSTAQYYEGTGDYDFGSDDVYQPIKYTLNSDKVNTILVGTQDVTPTDADLKVDRTAVDTPIKCTTKNTTLASIYKLTSSTKVLYVPAESADRLTTTEYTIKNGNQSGFEKNSSYRVVMVDVSASKTPALVIVYGASTAASSEWSSNTPKVVTYKQDVGDSYEITLEGSGSSDVYIDENGAFYDQVSIGDVVRVSADVDLRIEALEMVISAVDIYAGDEFVRTDQEEERSTRKEGASTSTSSALIKEGDNITEEAAQMVLMAGVAYEIVGDTMFMALDYPTADEEWTELGLANEGYLKNLDISGAKYIVVPFKSNGTVNELKFNPAAEVGQVATYASGAKETADKLFVYRAYNDVKLIVVFRAE